MDAGVAQQAEQLIRNQRSPVRIVPAPNGSFLSLIRILYMPGMQIYQ